MQYALEIIYSDAKIKCSLLALQLA